VADIRKALQRDWNGSYGIGDPKSARSRRTVILPALAVNALSAHKARSGRAVLPTAYVFATASGRPVSARNVVRAFKAALKAAGLAEVRFHDLRHSCNSLLDFLGVSARVRMDILGHSDVRLTENVYTHSTVAQRRQAAELIGEFMFARMAAPLATPDAASAPARQFDA
jgi:integrase